MSGTSVLFIHNTLEIKGGDTVYVYQLLDLLPSYGWEAYLMSITLQGDTYKISQPNEQDVWKKPHQLKSYVENFCQAHDITLINIQTCHDPHIKESCSIHIPIIKSSHTADSVCPGKGKFWRKSRVICDIPFGLHCVYHIYKEGCANRKPSSVAAAVKDIHYETNKGAKQYSFFIVMSDYIKEECLKVGIPQDKIKVVPYFTDLIEDIPSVCFPSPPFKMLYVGRLSETKGVTVMLDALKELLKTREDVRLDIVGDGIDKKDVLATIEQHQLQDKVIMHGWLAHQEVQQMIAQTHLVLFPSIYPEAFGIVGIEAMMHAKPVVAFEVGGVGMWLTSGETGMSVPVHDQKGFRESVERMMTSPELYCTLAQGARDNALERFIPEKHIEALLTLYRMAMAPVNV